MQTPETQKLTIRFKLDYRILCIALAVAIVGMVLMWRPWEGNKAGERTIEVMGQATVTAVPDEFVFSPSYEFKNANKQDALTALTKKNEEIVAKLKELGVAEEKIKTNSGGYDYPVYKDNTLVPTYTLTFTITTDDKAKAQKVQDYLVTTTPTGALTPQATFSDSKRKELENRARDEATKDARTKAEQSAQNLGFGLGAVKTVADGTGFGGILYHAGRDEVTTDAAGSSQLSLQPGENNLDYTVTVTYFVK